MSVRIALGVAAVAVAALSGLAGGSTASRLRDAVLSVTVSGEGRVTSSPAGIDCPSDCSEPYPIGRTPTTVTLAARPGGGHQFDGWGGACGGAGSCVVRMDADKSVSARFSSARTAGLAVVVRGRGRVSSTPPGIDCPGDCSESYPFGNTTSLRPEAAEAYRFAGWQGACGGTADCAVTMNGGKVAVAVFRTTRSTEPSRKPTDADRDGVADEFDLCPGTPRRLKLVARGCSAPELSNRAVLLLGELESRVATARRALPLFEPLKGVAAELGRDEKQLELAARILAKGNPCGAAKAAARAVASTLGTADETTQLVKQHQAALVAQPRLTFGDVDERDIRIGELEYRRQLVDGIVGEVKAVQRTFAAACSVIAGKRTVRGRVVQTLDSSRLVRLSSGALFGIPDVRLRRPILEGNEITVSGYRFRRGGGLATQVTSTLATAATKLGDCARFRIAPVQLSSDPITYHAPGGYDVSGLLWLEQGMKFGVEKGLCPKKKSKSKESFRFSLQLDLYYKDTATNGWTTTTLAYDLLAGEDPVSLPSTIDAGPVATLTVTQRKQDCHFVPKPKPHSMCMPAVDVSTKTYQLRVLAKGAYASANYDKTVFALEDTVDPSSYDSATVTGLSMTSAIGVLPNAAFEAKGCLVAPTSSRPSIKKIHQGDKFAVYQIYDDYCGPTSGLSFPTVKGTRNGHAYWYSVVLPSIVRDVVTFCPNAGEDSYYRLPWAAGGLWNVTQGNNTTFSHKAGSWNQFAFDFIMPDGQTIVAARGGRVGFVDESNSANDDPNDPNDPTATPNMLRIDHQDGTSGFYLHMQHNGILINLNQYVRRGQPVGIVGNTGFSTDPHVHFQAGSNAASIQIRLEGLRVAEDIYSESCYIPTGGQQFVSTNTAP